MNYQTKLQTLKLFLEDKIRYCVHEGSSRDNKYLKNQKRIYCEVLAMLKDLN